MAIELLRAVNNKPIKHTAAHNLKSFVYLLCWIVTFFAGPESQLCENTTKLAIEGWYEGNDLIAFANNKEGCMASASHLKDITSYYGVLSACIGMLSELVRHQLYAECHARDPAIAQFNYYVGSKRPRSEDNEQDPLNHDAVISILHQMCLHLCGRQIPESGDFLQPFYLTKKECTSVLRGTASSDIPDFGGGHHLKRRWIMHRVWGPIQSAQ
ncbi:hypothetical protein PISMIDRAFT_13716 [Pisolithus microcarpus 441]|uniref:Fungal-type protein kinase domain-containing protein n=1 Tax=Pisolithus microcarpus 441 TaxID=765257 RepID=A0A0C9ZHC2_9AGAM|nr:hypothetical protein PISMIDRAFT_13716 [Pisolithus microcarpus 441]